MERSGRRPGDSNRCRVGSVLERATDQQCPSTQGVSTQPGANEGSEYWHSTIEPDDAAYVGYVAVEATTRPGSRLRATSPTVTPCATTPHGLSGRIILGDHMRTTAITDIILTTITSSATSTAIFSSNTALISMTGCSEADRTVSQLQRCSHLEKEPSE
jgi:hypothetical protein